MDPVTIGLIIAGVGAAASGGASIWGSHKASESAEEQEAYVKQEQEKKDREARRQALAKAIQASHASVLGLPQPVAPPPSAPDMMGPAILGGVGNVAGAVGGGIASKYANAAPDYGKIGQAGLMKGAGSVPRNTSFMYDEFGYS